MINRKTVGVCILLVYLMVTNAFPQACPVVVNDTTCGNYTIQGGICTGLPAQVCAGIPFGIEVTQITAGFDSVYACWDDGTINGYDTSVPACIYHTYNYRPDSCIMSGSTNTGFITKYVTLAVVKRCGSNRSSNRIIIPIDLYFLPHAEYALKDTCDGVSPALVLNKNCGNSPSATWLWNFGDGNTSNLVNPWPHAYAGPGTYYTSLTITNGCGSSTWRDTVVIKPPTQLINISGIPSTICVNIPLNLTINASNAGSYSTTVTGGSGATVAGSTTSTPTVTFSNTGNYTLNFVVSGCCLNNTCSQSIPVTVSPGPNLSLSQKPDTCFVPGNNFFNPSSFFSTTNSSQTNSIYIIPAGGGPPVYQYNGTGIPNTQIPVPNSGCYIVIDSSSTSCPGVLTRRDTVCFTQAIVLPSYVNDTVCPGATLSIDPPPPGVILTLNGNPFSGSGYTFPSGGTYQFAYTPVACGSPSTYTVVVNNNPAVTLTTKNDTCFVAGSSSLNPSGFFSAAGSSQTNNITIIPVGSGTPLYQFSGPGIPNTSVSVTGAGCYAIIDSSITTCPNVLVLGDTVCFTQPIVLPAYPGDTICPGETLPVSSPPPGVSLTLNGSPFTGSSYTFPSSGTYYFVYTPVTCGNSSTHTVIVKNAPNIQLNPRTECITGGVINLNGSPAGGTYYGNYVINGNQFDVTAAGIGVHAYSYVVVDIITGCKDSVSSSITVIGQTVTPYIAQQAICGGSSFQLICPMGVAAITLDGNNYSDDTLNIVLHAPGWHVFTVQGNGSCYTPATDSVFVNQAPSNISLAASPDTACGNTVITLNNTTAPIPNSVFSILLPNGSTTSTSPYNFNGILPANADSIYLQFVLTVSVANCGALTDTQTVKLYGPSAAGFTASFDTVCPFDVVQFANTSTNAWMIDSVIWLIDGVFASNSFDLPGHTFSADSVDTTHYITLIVHNKLCNTWDTIVNPIFVHPENFPLIINSNQAHYCQGESFTLNTNSLPSGTTVWWTTNFNTNIYSGITSLTQILDSAGTFQFTVHAQNCSYKTFTISLTINPRLDVEIVIDSVSKCSGKDILFGISTSGTGMVAGIDWNFGDGSAHSHNLPALHSYQNQGNYPVTVIITSNYQCRDTASVVVPVNQTPVAGLSLDTSLCQFTTLDLSEIANGSVFNQGDSLLWNLTYNGVSSIAQNNFIELNDTGSIELYLLIDNNGCRDSSLVTATVYPTPQAIAKATPPATTIHEPEILFENMATTSPFNEVYQWDFGDSSISKDKNAVHSYKHYGIYTVILTVANQFFCVARDTIEVTITNEYSLYIPKAFTPNNDLLNDIFYTPQVGVIAGSYSLSVFDRWGELVFYTDKPGEANGWNGKRNNAGEASPQGVYIYTVKYKHATDVNVSESKTKAGTVTLLR